MIGVFNPTGEDFEKEWFDDENNGHLAKVPSMQIAYFENWLGELVAKGIANRVYFARGQQKNYEDDMKNLLQEIIIDESSTSVINS